MSNESEAGTSERRTSPPRRRIDRLRADILIAIVGALGGILTAFATNLPGILKTRAESRAIVDTASLIQRFAHNWMDSVTQRMYFESAEPGADEASGGASLNDTLYVVDDEDAEIPMFAFHRGRGRYEQDGSLRLRDCRNGRRSGPDSATVENPADLEGAAAYDGRLYVVTSHGPTDRGNRTASRELFMEIAVRGGGVGCVTRAVSLRQAIDAALRPFSAGAWESRIQDHNRFAGVEVEGLAIGRHGTVYLGLRDPLLRLPAGPRALVLHAHLDNLFGPGPRLAVIPLRLTVGQQAYGISSLEYDAERHRILVLGANPAKDEFGFPVAVWSWEPDLTPRDRPREQVPELLGTTLVPLPAGSRAKAEALIWPAERSFAVVFLDSRGYGGQRVVPKSAFAARP